MPQNRREGVCACACVRVCVFSFFFSSFLLFFVLFLREKLTVLGVRDEGLVPWHLILAHISPLSLGFDGVF